MLTISLESDTLYIYEDIKLSSSSMRSYNLHINFSDHPNDFVTSLYIESYNLTGFYHLTISKLN